MKNYKFKVKRNARKNILGMRVMFKKCTKCGKVLFRNCFHKDKGLPTGLTSQCRECRCSVYSHTCEQCGKEFKSKAKKQRFCSQLCKSYFDGTRITFNCDYCGKECNTTISHYNNNKNHFCSQKCKAKWQEENNIGENNPSWKGGSIKHNCDYCGKEIEIKKCNKNRSKNYYCSKECQDKHRSVIYSGENHPNYNPNITDEEREIKRNYAEYKDFIRGVYERDNYTCQCCGKRGYKLNAHHIYGYAEHKDLRIDLNNGVTLCEECHKKYHKIYGRVNNNYKDFRTFLYNEMMKQNTLEAKLFYINTIENITLRLEIRGLLGLESA